MRVSTFQSANWAKSEMMRLASQQMYHRNQVTSGQKNIRMSEDPLAASKSFALQHSLANIEQMQKDLEDSKSIMKQTESTLGGIRAALDRVDVLTIQAISGTNGPTELKAIGAEIEQKLKEVVYLANTKEDGRYIFGGEEFNQPPFADDGTYQGGTTDVKWTLNDGYDIKVFRDGKDLLSPAIKTLAKVKDALLSGDQAALQPLMQQNKDNADKVSDRRTEVGSTLNTLEAFKNILSEQNMAIVENKKEIEDVDLASAISDLSYINATYEATLKAVSTMGKISILDYM
ncbi:flagellar hook-associated protein 3 [Bacillus cytotoxicus]|uniref:Flagellar hook-associated protein 3 n=1 Tax=Bacillus cytotoxicus TaxID=580165 RepID=A0ACC6A9C5_9BACI|nr:flagellar hook-associated protein 3 [Bacillus cytotoxicus]